MARGRIYRLAETDRKDVEFRLDGKVCSALEGDTVLTAVLSNTDHVRQSEFGPEARAGFCLMGACQDCWVWQEGGPRVRACSTLIEAGMHILTAPMPAWPDTASGE